MTQSKRFAITGGIGSGKSVFSQILREKGYPVFSCDEIYAVLRTEESYLSALKELFPDCVKDGVLEKAALAARVFSDENELARLNALSHPLIMKRLFERMQQEPVAFAEVPLLFEGGYEGQFDGVIALVRDRNERIRNVMRRDGLTEQEVLARISRQADEKTAYEKSCLIVENNGTLNDLKNKAEDVLRAFRLL